MDQPITKLDLKGHTIEELANFANVSTDFIKMTIEARQQLLMTKDTTYSKDISSEIKRKKGSTIPVNSKNGSRINRNSKVFYLFYFLCFKATQI